MYKVDTGSYPTQTQGLAALTTKPEDVDPSVWGGPYVDPGVPKDPWGHDYIYVFPGKNNKQGFDLYSLGEDGKTATAGNDPDDINNWDPESGRSYYPRGDPTRNFMRRLLLLVLLIASGIYAVSILVRVLRRESS